MSERGDIEMALIRTMSVNGLILSGKISAEDRRERIRIAVLQQRRAADRFDDHLTFAQAYERCYCRPLEQRRDRSEEDLQRMNGPAADADVTTDEEEADK